MTLKALITNEMLEQSIRKVSKFEFNTFDVSDVMEIEFPMVMEEIKKNSPTRYKSVVGQALTRFEIETGKITRVRKVKYSPLVWHK